MPLTPAGACAPTGKRAARGCPGRGLVCWSGRNADCKSALPGAPFLAWLRAEVVVDCHPVSPDVSQMDAVGCCDGSGFRASWGRAMKRCSRPPPDCGPAERRGCMAWRFSGSKGNGGQFCKCHNGRDFSISSFGLDSCLGVWWEAAPQSRGARMPLPLSATREIPATHSPKPSASTASSSPPGCLWQCRAPEPGDDRDRRSARPRLGG